MRDYLRKLPDDEVVCFVDAYDVILVRPLEELEREFRRFAKRTGATVVVGCEKPQWAFLRWAQHAIFGTCGGKPVNSGTYIGRCKDVHAMIQDMLHLSQALDEDDQVIMTRFCTTHPRMHVDCDSRFFLTLCSPLQSALHSCTDIRIRNGMFMFRDRAPFLVHGNGQTNLNDLIIALGYNMSPEEQDRINAYLWRTTIKKVGLYCSYFKWQALCVCLACVLLVFLRRRARRG